ncbi:MAG: methionine adenosyltransferase domain-containing protein, partial [Armatimonadota bacterium]
DERFDLTPAGIIEQLDLRRPIYRETAMNGHFGHPQFPWERVGVLIPA